MYTSMYISDLTYLLMVAGIDPLKYMYEIPKDDNIGRVTITKDYIQGTGGPLIEIRGNEKPLLS